MTNLSPEESFRLLLDRLDADPSAGAERYELLRIKLTKCAIWKGCPDVDAETLADETLDRVAKKLASGEVIESLIAYACQVLRFVWMEYRRKRIEEPPSGEEPPEVPVEPDLSFLDEPDVRLNCLRKCMNEVVPAADDRAIIVGYYDTDPGLKNKEHRKSLAERFGLKPNALKVRASRIRDRLERCINDCMQPPVTKGA